MMRTTFTMKLGTAGFLSAAAFSSTDSGAAPFALQELPLQAAPLLPELSSQPKRIPAGERVDGVFVADRREVPPGSGGYPALGVFARADLAERFVAQSYSFLYTADYQEAPCFHLVQPSQQVHFATSEQNEWPDFAQAYAEIGAYDYENTEVAAVRLERLVRGDQGARLEATELWVDPSTAGHRLIQRSTLDLTEVATPAEGVSVYVARTGPERVEVVVSRVPGRLENELVEALPDEMNPHGGGLGMVASGVEAVVGQVSLSGQCGHLHFSMRPVDPEFGNSRETAAVTTAVVLGLTKARVVADAHEVPVEMTTRQLTVNLGFGRVRADEAPMLAVSYRWNAPAQVTFLPESQMAQHAAATRLIEEP